MAAQTKTQRQAAAKKAAATPRARAPGPTPTVAIRGEARHRRGAHAQVADTLADTEHSRSTVEADGGPETAC